MPRFWCTRYNITHSQIYVHAIYVLAMNFCSRSTSAHAQPQQLLTHSSITQIHLLLAIKYYPFLTIAHTQILLKLNYHAHSCITHTQIFLIRNDST